MSPVEEILELVQSLNEGPKEALRGRLHVFGSCATDKLSPGDVDIWLDWRDTTLDEARASGWLNIASRSLLGIANSHYGSFDPFIRLKSSGSAWPEIIKKGACDLLVRSDTATSWVAARNKSALLKAMDSISCSPLKAIDLRSVKTDRLYLRKKPSP